LISFGFAYSIFVFFIFIFIEYVWYLNFKNKKNYKSFWSENLFIKEYWIRSFDFTGKTRRKDFWFASFQIFTIYFLIGIPFLAITMSSIYSSKDPISTSNEFNQIVSFFSWSLIIISFIPSLSIQVRRLNDIGKEPGWVLLSFIPFISLILLFWYVKPSQNSRLTAKKKKESNNIQMSDFDDLSKVEEQLVKLKSMLNRGVISAEEYEELRKKNLGL
jgi:uncharacterized membrane protein YhaH (DUF805 family)